MGAFTVSVRVVGLNVDLRFSMQLAIPARKTLIEYLNSAQFTRNGSTLATSAAYEKIVDVSKFQPLVLNNQTHAIQTDADKIVQLFDEPYSDAFKAACELAVFNITMQAWRLNNKEGFRNEARATVELYFKFNVLKCDGDLHD